jgi:hypothetical protein
MTFRPATSIDRSSMAELKALVVKGPMEKDGVVR